MNSVEAHLAYAPIDSVQYDISNQRQQIVDQNNCPRCSYDADPRSGQVLFFVKRLSDLQIAMNRQKEQARVGDHEICTA